MSRSVKVLALVFGNGINIFLGFLLVPYLSRALSYTDYGSYGQTLMVVGFMITMLGFGLDKVLYADLADDEIPSGNAIKSNAMISFLFGLGGTVLVLIFAQFIANYLDNELLTNLILVYGFSIPFQLLFKSFTATLIYHGLVKETVRINVLTNMLRLAFIFIFVQVFYSLIAIFAALVLIPIIQALWSYLTIPSSMLENGKVSKSLMGDQISVGIPLGLTVIIGTVFKVTDGFMVSKLLGVDTYALFRNGAIQIPIIASLYASVNTIILPDVSKMFGKGQKKEIAALKTKALINTAAIIYPVILFFVLFSGELIPLYLSEKYAASYLVFAIFNCILFLRVTAYTDIYIASKRNNLLPKKFLITSILNLGFNYFFIQYWGMEGAAVATLLSYFILVSLLLKDGVKILDTTIHELVPFKRLGILFFGTLSLMACLKLIFHAVDNLWLIPPIGLFYFLTVYYIILKYDFLEKSIVRNLLSKSKVTRPFLNVFNRIYLT